MNDLEYLNLYANAFIEDSGFMDLAKSGYHKMQFLDFCGCKNLSDESVVLMSKSFINLKYFNLTWCISLTDKAIVEGISENLECLELLSVYGLVKITEKSFDALLSSKIRETLETLDINGCKEIQRSDEATIKSLFPRVRVTIFHS